MAKTYDEITRKTVPNPDTSFRPSPEQVKQAHEGFRALDSDEQALLARVRGALGGAAVEVEITHGDVTLRGTVDAATANRLPDLVRGLDGVDSVIDQLVIR